LRIHKYTSPHLVRFEERITVAGAPIDPGLLLELIGECERAAEGEEVSFFEFFTALAFLAFLGIYIILSLTISLIREQASI